MILLIENNFNQWPNKCFSFFHEENKLCIGKSIVFFTFVSFLLLYICSYEINADMLSKTDYLLFWDIQIQISITKHLQSMLASKRLHSIYMYSHQLKIVLNWHVLYHENIFRAFKIIKQRKSKVIKVSLKDNSKSDYSMNNKP